MTSMEDTMLMSYVLDAGKNRHNMDTLSDIHLGHKTIKYKDLVGSGKKEIKYDNTDMKITDIINMLVVPFIIGPKPLVIDFQIDWSFFTLTTRRHLAIYILEGKQVLPPATLIKSSPVAL